MSRDFKLGEYLDLEFVFCVVVVLLFFGWSVLLIVCGVVFIESECLFGVVWGRFFVVFGEGRLDVGVIGSFVFVV